MKQTNRFWKFVFITCATTLLATAGIVFAMWQTLTDQQASAAVSILVEHFEYVTLLALILFSVLFIGLEIIYSTYIKPLKKISAEASVIYASNPSHRIEISGNRDISHLVRVINDFAELFENLNKSITEQILTAREETEKERNLLAAIMAELPQGVIICNTNGRILLFNSLAKKIFTRDTGLSCEHFLGLGRSVFHLIDKTLIAQALEQIKEHQVNNRLNVASYFIAPVQAQSLIGVEVIPVLSGDRQMTGFILTIKDITEQIRHYDETHDVLKRVKKDIDGRLLDIGQMLSPRWHGAFKQIRHQFEAYYEKITHTVEDLSAHPIPLSSVMVPDLLSSIQKKLAHHHDIDLEIQVAPQSHRVLADFYSFTSAMVFLICHLSRFKRSYSPALSAGRQGNRIVFELSWGSGTIHKKDINGLMNKKINALPGLSYIFKQNRVTYKLVMDEQAQCSRIIIVSRAKLNTPVKAPRKSVVIGGSRPEFYDFDLFKPEDDGIELLDTKLKNLTYTVFDTETTGLNPEGGDEIISIAAVRIVNSRIVYQDIFDELVDPGRDIPIESYKIHGISYEMVHGKNDIYTTLPLFRNYVSKTVLVGHNIAFDMKMLKVKEKKTQIRFNNPVLDTLLLSAILHPVHEQHDMESIAKRLGVNIIGRHTALGDAIATAEIFLKIMAILNSNGILTLKDAIQASKKTYYARLKY